MKLTLSTLMAVACLFGLNSVYAQSSKGVSTMKTANTERTVHSYTFEVDSAKLATKKIANSSSTNTKDVAYYNNFISALETKREYVLNNPEEKAIAEKENWFVKIDKEIAKAKTERELLLQK